MNKLIYINENGVVWVESNGQLFGIVNAFKVLDEDGIPYPDQSFCDLIEDVEQDWENEANIIRFTEENGESSYLTVDVNGCELIETNN